MAKHSNLYYLFLEDQQKNLMPVDTQKKIQKNIEEFYKTIKPPWETTPPEIIREDKHL